MAFFLRYPNPYASHVLSCDVISRSHTPSGSLLTTRLILKRGALPRWAPKGIVSRAESWIIEESEVDPHGKMVRCRTKNLDHVKVMQVEEWVMFNPTPEGYVTLYYLCFSILNFGIGKLYRQLKPGYFPALAGDLQRESKVMDLADSRLMFNGSVIPVHSYNCITDNISSSLVKVYR